MEVVIKNRTDQFIIKFGLLFDLLSGSSLRFSCIFRCGILASSRWKNSALLFVTHNGKGTPGGIQYFGKLEEYCYWGNEVKLYDHHVDALYAMFWRKEPRIKYYVCTINKAFAKPSQRMYFQVHYTEENLKDYIDPHDDTLKIRLADGNLLADCRMILGTDKRATITTNWSEFCHRANITEGDICAFRFKVTTQRRLALTVHRL